MSAPYTHTHTRTQTQQYHHNNYGILCDLVVELLLLDFVYASCSFTLSISVFSKIHYRMFGFLSGIRTILFFFALQTKTRNKLLTRIKLQQSVVGALKFSSFCTILFCFIFIWYILFSIRCCARQIFFLLKKW